MALTIVRYHAVDRRGSLLSVTPVRFAAPMDAVAASGREVMTVAQVARRLATGRDASRAVCITFDDGYRSVADHAWPILKQRGMTATTYFVTGMADFRPAWLQRLFPAIFSGDAQEARAALEKVIATGAIPDPAIARDPVAAFKASAGLPIMSWDEARRLVAEGMEAGGHTISHPYLTRLRDAEKATEIVKGKEQLEKHLGTNVETFAYPFGDHDDACKRIVREAGYTAAVTSDPGANPAGSSDMAALRRIGVWNTTGRARMTFYLSALYRLYKAMRP